MKKTYKPVILAADTLQILGLVVMTPVLSDISRELGASDVFIKTMVTLPSVFSMAVTQAAARMANFMPKKPIILTGLAVFFAGGFGAYYVHDIYTLMFCRALTGIGLGLFYATNISLVSDCYEGRERMLLAGKTQAVNYLGGVLAILLAGVLAKAHWRNVFFLYFAAAAVFVLDLFLLPALPVRPKPAQYHRRRLPRPVYALAAAAGLSMTAFYGCVTNISDALAEAGRPSGTLSNFCVAAIYLGCFVTGMVLSRIQRLLGRFTIPCSILGMCLGCLMISGNAGYEMIAAGGLVIGFSDGVLIPNIYAVSSQYASEDSAKVTAVIAFGIAMGQFAAPLCFVWLRDRTAAKTVTSGFGGMAAVLALISLILCFHAFYHNKKESTA